MIQVNVNFEYKAFFSTRITALIGLDFFRKLNTPIPNRGKYENSAAHLVNDFEQISTDCSRLYEAVGRRHFFQVTHVIRLPNYCYHSLHLQMFAVRTAYFFIGSECLNDTAFSTKWQRGTTCTLYTLVQYEQGRWYFGLSVRWQSGTRFTLYMYICM